jgi:hypothetical protein
MACVVSTMNNREAEAKANKENQKRADEIVQALAIYEQDKKQFPDKLDHLVRESVIPRHKLHI